MNPQPHARDPQKGWSLMESLMTLVLIGVGLTFFLRTQNISWGSFKGNSNMLKAGQLIESHVEGMRVHVMQDTASHWPPGDTSFTENGLHLERKVGRAYSPKDGKLLDNVRKVSLSVSWGEGTLDSIKVTTYVSKKF